MYLKAFSTALTCLLMTSFSLQAQQFLDPCDESENMARVYNPYGVAYEDGYSTSQLVVTTIIGTAAVALVVGLLWNSNNNGHGHGHGKHSHNRNSNHCSH